MIGLIKWLIILSEKIQSESMDDISMILVIKGCDCKNQYKIIACEKGMLND